MLLGTHDFKELTQNDQRLDDEIHKRTKEVDSLQTTIQQWRAKIRTLLRDTEERNKLLLDEKHSIQKHYQQLKQRIQVYRASQNQRLLQLSQAANECKEKLKAKLSLAQKVLNLAELSRNLETTYEQILPFVPAEVEGVQDSTIHGDKQKNEDEDEEEPSEEDAAMDGKSLKTMTESMSKKIEMPPAHQSSVWSHNGRPVPPEDRLANFYRKYNNVMMDTIAIQKEKDRLELENNQLEDLVRQFIQGTKLDEEVLKSANPLFVVNGRANLNHVPPVRQQKPTIQNANIINNAQIKQLTVNNYI
jgi:dynein regulatory complex subunit 2